MRWQALTSRITRVDSVELGAFHITLVAGLTFDYQNAIRPYYIERELGIVFIRLNAVWQSLRYELAVVSALAKPPHGGLGHR